VAPEKVKRKEKKKIRAVYSFSHDRWKGGRAPEIEVGGGGKFVRCFRCWRGGGKEKRKNGPTGCKGKKKEN